VTGHLALAAVAAGVIFCLGWAAGHRWRQTDLLIRRLTLTGADEGLSRRGPQAPGQPPRTAHELLEDAFDQAERHGREPEVTP
jgi:hypothetical protein